MRALAMLAGPLLLAAILPLPAQARRLPSNGGSTASLGQPGVWQTSIGGAIGVRSELGDQAVVAEGRVGVYRELLNRVLGIGGLQLEAYSGSLDTRLNGGVRARFVSPFARVAVGADYNLVDGRLRPIFSLVNPMRRGGVFHDGSMIRLDLLTGPNRSVTVGIEKPVFRRIPLGTTRLRSDYVPLVARRPPALPVSDASAVHREAVHDALANARTASHLIQALCAPWLDHTGAGGAKSDSEVVARLREIKRTVSEGGDSSTIAIERETRRLHHAIDRAFELAIAPETQPSDRAQSAGVALGSQARAILLREVLLPYDRLLGQIKEKDTTREFAVFARGEFLRWMLTESRIPRGSVDAALAVFTEFLEIVEENRAAAHREWGGSRFVWLPLQFALLPEQHDTQEELDSLVEQAVGESFTEGNFAAYIINEQFQYQLSRTIREAKDYHVLLTHDFRGHDAQGDPDEMSYRHVLRSYLAAMTARVRAYDSTGTFPVYMIFLDEWFYEVNNARLWMSLLEDPTWHRVHLPARFQAWEDSLSYQIEIGLYSRCRSLYLCDKRSF